MGTNAPVKEKRRIGAPERAEANLDCAAGARSVGLEESELHLFVRAVVVDVEGRDQSIERARGVPIGGRAARRRQAQTVARDRDPSIRAPRSGRWRHRRNAPARRRRAPSPAIAPDDREAQPRARLGSSADRASDVAMEGTPSAASTPMMITTTISSSSVKPAVWRPPTRRRERRKL